MILNLSHRPLISPLFYARNLNTVDLWLPATSTSEKILKFLRQMLRTILRLFWSDSEVKVYCLDPIDKQPSSLNWQVFIWAVFLACWLASAGDGRRCSSSLRSCGNSIQGWPPTPPTGHQAHTCKQGRTPLASTVPTLWMSQK